ncbi:MAG TPA: 2-oxo acid dehydrogenase subunit E2 [Streptosporangiaceae bacterium]|nr:2-oxo acid dehydrogenase subunit E2 [Streptosporangiaceae bacterium]
MSVPVRMPQLGESVTEGTVTRWLKKEGDLVNADEPLLEVSTDKVDTEIPSPASGVLRGIVVAEEETVEVGAELAVIEEEGAQSAAAPSAAAPSAAAQEPALRPVDGQAQPGQFAPPGAPPAAAPTAQAPAAQAQPPYTQPRSQPFRPPGQAQPGQAQPGRAQPERAEPAPASHAQVPPSPWPAQAPPAGEPAAGEPAGVAAAAPGSTGVEPAPAAPPDAAQTPPAATQTRPGMPQYAPLTPLPGAGEGPYITPLVRKLAAEHGVDLGSVQGTGVGGRIRKQDVIEASRALRAPQAATPSPADAAAPGTAPAAPATPASPGAAAPAPAAAPAGAAPAAAAPAAPVTAPGEAAPPVSAPAARPAIQPSPLRGTTERMSRLRQVIAQRMVDSLHTSAQLTTVVEADVTKIARLRQRAKADFERREGVRLSFLPFFTLATLEALKMHPKLNAVIDTDKSEVTYYDVEHLGIAVDTDRGLLVPVIRNAGDLNIGGLARKIDDLARRTRAGQVSPDELSGGTFTLTNTGSRGAIFDTPIINQPQVAILGTGAVVKRPVAIDHEELGEVIAVRSMVYLALTYDHRLVDGADAARFLGSVKARLEEGTFEAELGL